MKRGFTLNIRNAGIALSVVITLAAGTLLYKATRDPIVDSSVHVISTEVKDVRCIYSGYCFGCGAGYDGNLECKPAFRAACPGIQEARVEALRQTNLHKSGKESTKTLTKVVEEISRCS